MQTPKVFISYSWSSGNHCEWVRNIAEHLVGSGIDVILDIWELELGHDTNHFMEKIVSDRTITKTLLICDHTYVEKANNRTGGVGTETQIISKEVYASAGENKFIAVIAERNESGEPVVPVFYTSRMYVDLSSNDAYSQNLETLVRAIFGKPLHTKPALGQRPAFLDETSNPKTASPLLYNRASNLLKDGKSQAIPALREYFDDFSSKLEEYRIASKDNEEFDEILLKNIDSFLPHRNELLQITKTAITYADNDAILELLHRLLEQIAQYTTRPEHITSFSPVDFDNYKFFAKEIFLSIIAFLIKERSFELADSLLSRGYYFKVDDHRHNRIHEFTIFCQSSGSIEARNRRLSLRRASLEADLIKERSLSSLLSFEELMQADFILFVRARLSGHHYWPDLLTHLDHYPRPFELFVRSASRAYFESVKGLMGAQDKASLEGLADDSLFQRPFAGRFFNIAGLLNIEELCTRV